MSKKLTIDYTTVKTVTFGEKTELRDGALTLNKEELIRLASSGAFSSFDIKLASPGESCRILGLHDAMQPRCKADRPEESYPGIWGALAPAGAGRTVALRGVLVSEIYYAKCNVKRYLDMCEPAARFSQFARHHHVIIDAVPAEGIGDLYYAEALKKAALTVNVALAKLAIGTPPDFTEEFSYGPLTPAQAEGLPKAAYLCIQMASNETLNFLYYGQSALGYLPTVIQPTELLDGAVIGRYWEDNYFLQTEPFVKELLSRHGRDLNFVGMVFANNVMRSDEKSAMTMIAASICKDILGADCVMVNKSGMGHAQLDAAMAFNWCQKLGMTAVVNLACVSNETPGDMLVIADSKLDAIIQSGRDFILHHPKVARLIGEDCFVPCLLGYDPWGPFDHTTNCAFAGVNSQLGDNFVTSDADLDWTAEGGGDR